MNIPKIIHQTGPYVSINKLIRRYKLLHDNNKKYMEGYSYRYRNDKQCVQDIKHFQEQTGMKKVLHAYKMLIPNAYKADIWRLCCLYLYGGIYNDFTHKYLRSIDTIIDHSKDVNLILCKDVKWTKIDGIQISFIAVVPNHDFIKFSIQQQINNVLGRKYGISSLDITGPICFYKSFLKYYDLNYNYEFIVSNNIISLKGDKIMVCFEQTKEKYIVNTDGEKIIKTRTNKDKFIFQRMTKKVHYSLLWKEKKVYK